LRLNLAISWGDFDLIFDVIHNVIFSTRVGMHVHRHLTSVMAEMFWEGRNVVEGGRQPVSRSGRQFNMWGESLDYAPMYWCGIILP